MRIIALEEEFVTKKIMKEMIGGMAQFKYTLQTSAEIIGESLSDAFTDLGHKHLAAMDEAGIDLQVLSFCAPQVKDAGQSVEMMKEGNDKAATAIKKNPTRYSSGACKRFCVTAILEFKVHAVFYGKSVQSRFPISNWHRPFLRCSVNS